MIKTHLKNRGKKGKVNGASLQFIEHEQLEPLQNWRGEPGG